MYQLIELVVVCCFCLIRQIFDWNAHIKENCFVIALEVIDNFPHDKLVTVNNTLHETFIKQSGESTRHTAGLRYKKG